MNYKILSEVIKRIYTDDIPRDFKEFGGAGLIVTNDKNNNYQGKDVLVISHYNHEISWLVYMLAKVFKNRINWLNKFDFYPMLGKEANQLISKKVELDKILLTMIIKAIIWAKDPKNHPENRPSFSITFHI